MKVTTLKEGGGRVDWSHKLNLIAFDMIGPDGCFDVYTMKPDGSDVRPLTVDHQDLPGARHIGQPAWHPSGKYLVFQAEKARHRQVRLKRVVTPGCGVYNELWLLELATNRARPIREVADERGNGVLHPHFSDDGKKLSWTEMTEPGGLAKGRELGCWKLIVADFTVEDGKPQLTAMRSMTPHGEGFYENHGFSPDGRQLIYSCNAEAQRRVEAHIYVMDLKSGRTRRLTDSGWNEHALFSPDGRQIVWMSSVENPSRGTDLWLMNADGSGKRRLTWFNREGHEQYAGRKIIMADSSWGPSGRELVAKWCAGTGLASPGDIEKVIKVELLPEAPAPPARGGR